MSTYRIVATQETGEEAVVKIGIEKQDLDDALDECRENYPEWTNWCTEREQTRAELISEAFLPIELEIIDDYFDEGYY